jgi:hypothetical protein
MLKCLIQQGVDEENTSYYHGNYRKQEGSGVSPKLNAIAVEMNILM